MDDRQNELMDFWTYGSILYRNKLSEWWVNNKSSDVITHIGRVVSSKIPRMPKLIGLNWIEFNRTIASLTISNILYALYIIDFWNP